MGLVAQTIKTIAEAIPNTVFLQLSDTQKVEFELSKIALAGKTAIVYNDLPDITIIQNALNITEEYPIEVWFLGLQSNFDDVSIETLLDTTKAIQAIFYNDLKVETFINLEKSSDIELNAGTTYRVGAESLSGWQFLMTLSLEGCPPELIQSYNFANGKGTWDLSGTSEVKNGILFPEGAALAQMTNNTDTIPNGTFNVSIVIETDNSGGEANQDITVQQDASSFIMDVSDSDTHTGVITFNNSPTQPFFLILPAAANRDYIVKSILITSNVLF